MPDKKDKHVLTDGSMIIIEALVSSGAEVFIGYPITPANLLYAYASQRFPIFLPASDEITALQWVSGFSATGKFAVTATSFPGFALMIETINMAVMMELPMVIVIAQRLGPSTGSATANAQGDLFLLRGCVSGGYQVPVFCPSDFIDCWDLSYKALSTAVELRTPVILLTSKETVMTNQSVNLSQFRSITPVKKIFYSKKSTYIPYHADNEHSGVPPFLPLGNNNHQVRINASTHDSYGFIKKATPEAMANTKRLREKIESHFSKQEITASGSEDTIYHLDNEEGSGTIVVTYGITSNAAREAVKILRADGCKVSLFIIKALLPVSPLIMEIINRYRNIIFVEENLPGMLQEILFGQTKNKFHRSVNKIGEMISPTEIINGVRQNNG
ncbi:MAG: hypothetical protein ABII90_03360 [Bacteroidota bacterium]